MQNHSLEKLVQDLYSHNPELRASALDVLSAATVGSFASYEIGRDLYDRTLEATIGFSLSAFVKRAKKKATEFIRSKRKHGFTNYKEDFKAIKKLAKVVGPAGAKKVGDYGPYLGAIMTLQELAGEGNRNAIEQIQTAFALQKVGIPEADVMVRALDVAKIMAQHKKSVSLLVAAGKHQPEAISQIQNIKTLAKVGNPTGVKAYRTLAAARLGFMKSPAETETFIDDAISVMYKYRDRTKPEPSPSPFALPIAARNMTLLALLAS